jgi:hypothetical protein
MRVLDEVAAAINLARDQPGPRPVLSALGLEDQFTYTLHPKGWDALRRHLDCGLPPLMFVQGHWFLPEGFTTIWDLVEVAADAHPNWDPPEDRTVAAWRNAQVFAAVRDVMVEALCIDPEQVTREARLKADLGAY